MKLYNKYIIRSLAMPTIIVAITLTGIIWLTQALRFIDLIINKGLDISTFLYLAMLLIPSLLVIILPVSLFVSVLYLYNKLNSESELIVLKSAGISRMGLAIPALVVAGVVTFISYLISFYILPASYREFKDMQDFIRNNYASVLLQEGVFSTPIDKLTVYIESRDDDGNLRGIMVHDARNPNRPVTMMAQEGSIAQGESGPRFNLVNGNRQEIDKSAGNLSFLYFDSYALDLSVYGGDTNKRSKAPEEQYVHELLFPDETDLKTQSKLIAEGHHRIAWPFFAITMTLAGLAILFSGQFNRRGQWKRLLGASACVVGLIVLDLAFKNLTALYPILSILLYLNVIVPAGIALHILMNHKNLNGFSLSKIKLLIAVIFSRHKLRGEAA